MRNRTHYIILILVLICAGLIISQSTQSTDIHTLFEAWASSQSDDDGDGVPNSIDLCPDTESHLVQLYRADLDEDNKPSESDFILRKYHVPLRFFKYSEGTAHLRLIEGVDGLHRSGTQCKIQPYTLLATKGKHVRIKCTNYMIVLFDVDEDYVSDPIIYVNVHPMVMVPLEWLNDEEYQNSRAIYTYIGIPPPENALDMGIPVGCRIDFPLKKWKGKAD